MDRVNRRRFLELAGSTVLGFMSGCGDGKLQDQQMSANRPVDSFQSDDSVFKERLPSWENGYVPKSLEIPSINFFSEIQLSRTVPIGIYETYEAPDSGIATPETPFSGHIFIFGHSRWRRVMQDFSKISKLNLGDIIMIRNQNAQLYHFAVNNFRLVNPDTIFLGPRKDLLLTLQTTAVDVASGKLEEDWILDMNEVVSKVGSNRPSDLDQHLVLMVDAIQVRQNGQS